MGACEHCGPIRGKGYEWEGITWCRACFASMGNICYDHPTYKAKLKPRIPCEDCWRLWFAQERNA